MSMTSHAPVATATSNGGGNSSSSSSSSPSSSSSYQPPTWAVAPPSDEIWTLVEIKNGVPVAEYKLRQQAVVLFGRDADVCDIVLGHASCSRYHARLAFDSTGICWLRDLQSTHGTTVNKKRLPEAACSKRESTSSSSSSNNNNNDHTANKAGARGVIVFPGDLIQFGASTRLYNLEGPPKYERGAMAAAKAQQQTRSAGRKTTTPTSLQQSNEMIMMNNGSSSSSSGNASSETMMAAADEPEEGVSWGLDMDDPIITTDDHDNDAQLLPDDLDESKIPPSCRKQWEKLRALRYKLSHVQQESERIRRKQGSTSSFDEEGLLTEGQKRQLARNEEREQSLRSEMRSLESSLHQQIFPNQQRPTARRAASQDGASYADEDEVEDQTQESTDYGDGLEPLQDGETEASLLVKRKKLLDQQKQAQTQLATLRQRAAKLRDRVAAFTRAGDEEAFFAQNDLTMAQEAVDKAAKTQRRGDELRQETERLLRVVNPKIILEPSMDSIRSELTENSSMQLAASLPPSTNSKTMGPPAMGPPPMRAATLAEAPPIDGVMPPPPPPPKQTTNLQNKEGTTMDAQDSFVAPPPPKRPRVLGPSMPPPAAAAESSSSKNSRRSPPVVRGTLAILTATTGHSSSSSSANGSSSSKSILPGLSPSKEEPDNDTIIRGAVVGGKDNSDRGEKHDAWQAPKDQDGSGKTRLNAKFAGRY